MLKTVGIVVGIGCVPAISLTFLGAIIGLAGFIISPIFSETLNTPGAGILLIFMVIPFVLVGAVGGAILGVVISGVIALIIWLRSIWLRSKKTTQDEVNTEIK